MKKPKSCCAPLKFGQVSAVRRDNGHSGETYPERTGSEASVAS